MAFLSTYVERELYCKICAKPVIHGRKAFLLDGHCLVMFFTLGLWAPIAIGAATLSKFRKFRCKNCGALYRDPIPPDAATTDSTDTQDISKRNTEKIT